MGEDRIEFIALLSQNNMMLLQNFEWKKRDEKIKAGYFPFQFLFLQGST